MPKPKDAKQQACAPSSLILACYFAPVRQASELQESMNESEKKIVENIDNFDCHVTSVFDPNGVEPNFTYSTGLTKTLGVPELIVVGLSPELGHSIVNNYRDRVKAGEVFTNKEFYSDFLEGFDVTFDSVSDENKKEFLLSSVWFYEEEFEAIQLIFPTTTGVWPWDPDASESFQKLQPSLSGTGAW